MNKTSIVIADSQYLIRFALKEVVNHLEHLQLAGVASTEAQLINLVEQSRPKIVILDYNETGFRLESIEKVKATRPDTRIIIISADEEKSNILKALEIGINAFLTKSCDEDEIEDAIKAAIQDEKYFCSKVLDYLLEKSFGKGNGVNSVPLTSRQIEIVQLIAKGLVAKEIGALLNLSTHTIYTHRKKIMEKLSLKSSSELVMYAIQNGLIPKE